MLAKSVSHLYVVVVEKGRKDTVAGWSEFVKPYNDESKFLSSVWSSEGSPRGGQTFEKMKHSKRQ